MPGALKRFSDAADRFILRIGKILSWANGVLILVIVLQVFLRYGLGRGLVALEELEWHLYSIAFMCGLSYAAVTNAHVRVDLVSISFSTRTKEWIELFGVLFLILPFAGIVIYYGIEFWYASWIHRERSLAPMGLPWRWIIKAVIPVSFGLLILAALSRMTKALLFLVEKRGGNS